LKTLLFLWIGRSTRPRGS